MYCISESVNECVCLCVNLCLCDCESVFIACLFVNVCENPI